jgi:HNH endonuclease
MNKTTRFKDLNFMRCSNYCVSSKGTVWVWKDDVWKRMKPWRTAGYRPVVYLKTDDGKGLEVKIQELVLLAFVGPCPPGLVCCHWDDNSMNNDLSNLRWDTPKSNVADCIRNGKSKRSYPGEKNPAAKITENDVVRMREMFASGNYTQGQLAKIFGIAQAKVSAIVSGSGWKTAGGPITKTGHCGRPPKHIREKRLAYQRNELPEFL